MQNGYRSHLLSYLLCTWLLVMGFPKARSGGILTLNFIHKYSDEAKELMKARNASGLETWPSFGSKRYHQTLHEEDRARHARKLSTYNTLVFFEGNATYSLGATIGGLFYTIVDVGTPNKTFLVALDTGSDLFWVPCECKRCFPLSSPAFQPVAYLMNYYSPGQSTTSKPVTCTSPICGAVVGCAPGAVSTSPCAYTLVYGSGNSSGILVEDVMNFSPGNLPVPFDVKVPITFGCGELQTGTFLQGSSPDGLLGLGFSEISVPSILAKNGLVQNSFSMCFNVNYTGTLSFGDKGDPAQQTTPLLKSNITGAPHYFVEVEGIVVGSSSFSSKQVMIFDSGTSVTFFLPAMYKAVTTAYDSQIKLPRIPSSELTGLPYEFCYTIGPTSEFPNVTISLAFTGGGIFVLTNPYIFLLNNTNTLAGFCLAFLSGSIPIIGVNAMIGYSIVFDRDAMKLGWIPSDCESEVPGAGPTVSPAPSPGSPSAGGIPSGSPSPSPIHQFPPSPGSPSTIGIPSGSPSPSPIPQFPPSPGSPSAGGIPIGPPTPSPITPSAPLLPPPSASAPSVSSTPSFGPPSPKSGSGASMELHMILLLSLGLMQILIMNDRL